jgi:hypothetical protein
LPDPFIPLFPIIYRLCRAESNRVEKKRRTQTKSKTWTKPRKLSTYMSCYFNKISWTCYKQSIPVLARTPLQSDFMNIIYSFQ